MARRWPSRRTLDPRRASRFSRRDRASRGRVRRIHGRPRRCFSQAIDEIVAARVWSGIHFRIADEHGEKIGRQVARYRKQHYFHRAFEEDDRGGDEHDD
jgi:hypothetical protein